MPMSPDRSTNTPEGVLADTVRVALGNTDTPGLCPETRLEIVRGVLRTGWAKYLAATASASRNP